MGVFDRLRPASGAFSSPGIGGTDVNVDESQDFKAPEVRAEHRRSRFHRPKTVVVKPKMPEEDKHTPTEMIPVLTLLTAHAARVYNEEYFMLLTDLNNDGKPVADRHWVEVFGTLAGTVITTWDAASLDKGEHEVAAYLNITDATFKSIATLPSPQGDLENIIVLSTTMKNRFLLQFSTRKQFDEWTAAMRLATFEHQALQEAYTGALLSAKGTKLHGIRAMLTENKYEREEKCSVRFGTGMRWLTVRALIVPSHALKHKKERKTGFGKIEFWDTPANKPIRKGQLLATVQRASACYAVFPEKAVLMNASSLIKIEGDVMFEDEQAPRESSVFVMPDNRPGISGFEILIRTIIPCLDVFNLYGRPRRLNADKNDINSLLFAMPTLPKCYYCDVMDLYMLTAIDGAANWSHAQWCQNIKELLARKMATGYKGTGNIHEITQPSTPSSRDSSSVPSSRPSSMVGPPSKPFSGRDRERAVSEPQGLAPQLPHTTSQDSQLNLARVRTPTMPHDNFNELHGTESPRSPYSPGKPQRVAPRAPVKASPAPVQPQFQSQPPPKSAAINRIPVAGTQPNQPNRLAPPMGARPMPGHERSLSEGEDRNQIVTPSGPGLITPELSQNGLSKQSSPAKKLGLPDDVNVRNKSSESFASARSSSSDIKSSPGAPGASRDRAAPANLFDPTYRPSHMSYAEYSEYMKSYINGAPGPQQNSVTRKPVETVPELLVPTAVASKSLDSDPNSRPRGSPYATASPSSSPRLAPYPNAPGSPTTRPYLNKTLTNSDSSLPHPSGPRGPRAVDSQVTPPVHQFGTPTNRVVSGNSIKSVGSIPSDDDNLTCGLEAAPPVLKSVPRSEARHNPPSPKISNAQGAGWDTTHVNRAPQASNQPSGQVNGPRKQPLAYPSDDSPVINDNATFGAASKPITSSSSPYNQPPMQAHKSPYGQPASNSQPNQMVNQPRYTGSALTGPALNHGPAQPTQYNRPPPGYGPGPGYGPQGQPPSQQRQFHQHQQQPQYTLQPNPYQNSGPQQQYSVPHQQQHGAMPPNRNLAPAPGYGQSGPHQAPHQPGMQGRPVPGAGSMQPPMNSQVNRNMGGPFPAFPK